MNKWIHALGLMLLAALVCDLSGCALTNGWLAKKPSKKSDDEKLANSDKKSRDAGKDKTVKKKTAKEIADARAGKSKDKSKTDTATAKAKPGDPKTKAVDEEHEKYATADRQKRKKATADPDDDKAVLAASLKTDKPKKPSTPKVEPPKTDDELDQFVAKSDEAPATPKKKAAKEESFEDIIDAADDRVPVKKSVVQVKKEVSKSDANDDLPDWADNEAQPETKQVKSANIAESFEEELDTPFNVKAKAKAPESKTLALAEMPAGSMDDESSEFATSSKKKSAISKDTKGRDSRGFVAQCPNASPALCELLKQMDPADSESLRQGLYRIGQLDRDGAAAIPVLRKMLKHEDAFVRAHAALAMTRLNLSSPESDIVVIEAVKSRDANLRSFGVSILDEMGSLAAGVLDALGESLKDRDGRVRLRVAEVLIRHEKWEYPALQTLLACLKDKDENVRWLTAYSLAELAPEDSPETVQALMKAAHDRVLKVQVGAVYALGEIGPSAKRASEELRRLRSTSNDEELKAAIDYTLKQINS